VNAAIDMAMSQKAYGKVPGVKSLSKPVLLFALFALLVFVSMIALFVYVQDDEEVKPIVSDTTPKRTDTITVTTQKNTTKDVAVAPRDTQTQVPLVPKNTPVETTNLKTGELREAAIAQAYEDVPSAVQTCQRIWTSVGRDYCTSLVAQTARDVTVCDQVVDSVTRDQCIIFFSSKGLGTIELCDSISNPLHAQYCREGFYASLLTAPTQDVISEPVVEEQPEIYLIEAVEAYATDEVLSDETLDQVQNN
jgi:hypothetical protein